MQRSFRFEKRHDFSVVRLQCADAKRESDHFRELRNLIVQSEERYPSILQWFSNRVADGIASGERSAFVGYHDEAPVAAAVIKKGDHTKICHLRVSADFQDCHLGELFFSLMVLEVRNVASRIHFTLPEGLWQQRENFFTSFGFHLDGKAGKQYRIGEAELLCSAPLRSVWRNTLDRLPKLTSTFSVGGFNMENSFVLSLKPRWAESILSGQKRIEIRRRFSPKWVDKTLALYATHPVKSIVGEARVEAVVSGAPGAIWQAYKDDIGCSRREFDDYVQGRDEVFAILLTEARPYRDPVPVSELTGLLGHALTSPQSYCSVRAGEPWSQALSIATLIQCGLVTSEEPTPERTHRHRVVTRTR